MSIPFNSATCFGGTYAKERILQKERDVLKDGHRHRAKTYIARPVACLYT